MPFCRLCQRDARIALLLRLPERCLSGCHLHDMWLTLFKSRPATASSVLPLGLPEPLHVLMDTYEQHGLSQHAVGHSSKQQGMYRDMLSNA
jgi:hypothetical protein